MHTPRRIPPATGYSSSTEANAAKWLRLLAAEPAACKETLTGRVRRWEASKGSYARLDSSGLVGVSVGRLLKQATHCTPTPLRAAGKDVSLFHAATTPKSIE